VKQLFLIEESYTRKLKRSRPGRTAQ
jgi:hypothetical protein